MNKIDVWDVNFNVDYYLSIKELNINWFTDETTVLSGPEFEDTIKQSSNKKVVLLHWHDFQVSINNTDLSWADLIICFTTELIHKPWEEFYTRTIDYFNNKNIIFMTGGNLKNSPIPADIVFSPNLTFLLRVSLGNIKPDFTPVYKKPYLFDALFGSKKPGRILLFNELKKLNLLEHSIVNIEDGIHYQDNAIPDYRSPILDTLEEPIMQTFRDNSKGDLAKAHTSNGIDRMFPGNVHKMWASQVIPTTIYNNSWFSIVAETDESQHDFITEKTAKCFFSKRIFVCLAAPGHLKLLQEQGFKTFDTIIDESYDSDTNLLRRIKAISKQVQFLANSDPAELYQKAKSILDHNFNLINDMSWQMHNIKNFIKLHIDRLK